MKPRILLPLFLLLFIPVGQSTAQQSLDSKQAELTVWFRLKTMTPSDLQALMAKAQGGDAEAQCWVGVAYEQNWFGTTDVKEAVKWYQKAAEGGNPDAQVELGKKYEDGEGIEQSLKLAAEWYRKAAEHLPNLGGAGQGRNQLGLLYMKGRGVPQDYVQAYFWFSLNGPEGNTLDAKSHLSLAQIRETDRLVKEWREQHRVSPEVAA